MADVRQAEPTAPEVARGERCRIKARPLVCHHDPQSVALVPAHRDDHGAAPAVLDRVEQQLPRCPKEEHSQVSDARIIGSIGVDRHLDPVLLAHLHYQPPERSGQAAFVEHWRAEFHRQSARHLAGTVEDLRDATRVLVFLGGVLGHQQHLHVERSRHEKLLEIVVQDLRKAALLAFLDQQ